jgi:Fe-S-cluster containining protein
MTRLYQIEEAVHVRVQAIVKSNPDWPCRKGCDDCCRSLASLPRVTPPEWERIAAAVEALPPDTAALVRGRIRDASQGSRPFTCPMLDTGSGSCLIYEARPIACRAYGFYAEREYVLGCNRIEAIGHESRDVVWGNHAALEEDLRSLGPTLELPDVV